MTNEPDDEAIAQTAVTNPAWHFLSTAIRDADLRGAWPAADPTYRTCLAQLWLHANTAELAEHGYDRDDILPAMTSDDPDHELWDDFERVTLRTLRGVFALGPPVEHWGIGGAARVIAPDVELLYLHDRSELPGGVWEPGAPAMVMPIVMRLSDGVWRLLNLGYEVIPEPGWPPRIQG